MKTAIISYLNRFTTSTPKTITFLAVHTYLGQMKKCPLKGKKKRKDIGFRIDFNVRVALVFLLDRSQRQTSQILSN